jgi:hypothetical protein
MRKTCASQTWGLYVTRAGALEQEARIDDNNLGRDI